MSQPVIAFAPGFDTKNRLTGKQKVDATKVFQPEAKRFLVIHRGGDLVVVNNRQPKIAMAEHVLDSLLRGEHKWLTIALFCHGWSTGIQLGFDLKNIRDLARAIADTSEPDVKVLLYCCSTASTPQKLLGAGPGGDGGFADELRDNLCRFGAKYCRVMAHTTPGHSTKNPHLRFFEGGGSDIGGQGGQYVVRPGSTLWRRWKDAMAHSEMRFRVGHMQVDAIHRVLTSEQGQHGLYIPPETQA